MLEVGKNSYITVDEADEYFLGRLGADFWEELKPGQKEKALITATRKIDRFPFIGFKQSPKQVLQFPRCYYSNIFENVQVAQIPQQLKDAVCEEALTTLQYIENNSEDAYNGAIDTNWSSLKLGDASITMGNKSASGTNSTGTNSNKGGLLSAEAINLLSGLIKIGFDIPNPKVYEVY